MPRAPDAHSRPPGPSRRRRFLLTLAVSLAAAAAVLLLLPSEPVPEVRRVGGCRVLALSGTPEEMGHAHGTALRDEVRYVVRTVVGDTGEANLVAAERMARALPERYRRELAALADAAGVDERCLIYLQLFGDVARAMPWDFQEEDDAAAQCTAYAAFGPATATGELVAGRNMDYFDRGVSKRAAILIDYRPDGYHRFVTATWAGIINGWTLMNEKGLVTSNNTAETGENSLDGVSTCFLLRMVAEECASVDEATALLARTPRACGTAQLVAGGSPPDAAVLEFDAEAVGVRRAERGLVVAANGHRLPGGRFHFPPPEGRDGYGTGRYGTLNRLLHAHHGRIDRSMNFTAAEGVPLRGINLQSILLFPGDLSLRVAMGHVPACDGPFEALRMAPGGVEPWPDAPALVVPEAPTPAGGEDGPATPLEDLLKVFE